MALQASSFDSGEDPCDEILDLYSNLNPFVVPYPAAMPPPPQEVLFNIPVPQDHGVWLHNAHRLSFVGYVEGGLDEDQVDMYIRASDNALYHRLLRTKAKRQKLRTQPAHPGQDPHTVPQHPASSANGPLRQVQNVLSTKRKAEPMWEEPVIDPDHLLLENRLFAGEVQNNLMPRARFVEQSEAVVNPALNTTTVNISSLDGSVPLLVSRSSLLEAAEGLDSQLDAELPQPTPGTDLLSATQLTGRDINGSHFAHDSNSKEVIALRTARVLDTIETLRITHGIERKRKLRDLFLGNQRDEPNLKISAPIDRIGGGGIYKKEGLRRHERQEQSKRALDLSASGTEHQDHDKSTTLQRFLNPVPGDDHGEIDNSPLPCECGETGKWEDPMVSCAAELCHIGLYHLSCTELDSLPDEKDLWYCRNCAEVFNPQPKLTCNFVSSIPTPLTAAELPQYHRNTPPPLSSPRSPPVSPSLILRPPSQDLQPLNSPTSSVPSSPSPSFSLLTQVSNGESTKEKSSHDSSSSDHPTTPPSPPPLSTSPTTDTASSEKITPTTAEFLAQQHHRIVIPDSQDDSDTDGGDPDTDGLGLGENEQGRSDIVRLACGSAGVRGQVEEDRYGEGADEEVTGDESWNQEEEEGEGTIAPPWGVFMGTWA